MPTRISAILAAATLSAAALPAVAGAAVPARAHAATHTVSYRGKTRAGDPIRFTLAGSRVTKLSAFVPTACLSTHGIPLSGTDPFDPPGTFRIGRTDRVTAKRPNAIYHSADVTKNFLVTAKRDRAGRITGKLHVDYPFLMLIYSYPITARPYVCTGDTTFRLSPVR